MSIEIKTATLEPVRQTYAHIERRFGNKPASRYQEATYDVQSETNFHYRPLWQPDLELNDPRRTQIVMQDWYALKDPRQFYYGAYVQQRAKMQEVAESNYAFFEKRDLARFLSESAKAQVMTYLVPLRHFEHTANLNNMYGAAYGYGTAITQALLFNGMDRLGMAQYLSRIGLILDANTGESLIQAKHQWLEADIWQGLRALCEQTLVTEDWFEVMVAQNLVMDTLMTDLVYRQLDHKLSESGAQDVGMLLEFMQLWNKEAQRWMDAVLKTTASESAANQTLLTQWVQKWRALAIQALQPLAEAMLDENALAQALADLDKRLAKSGI
ncbi:Phenol hydroxylase P1 protein [Allopseudospirillum japonicum]|uniref:Phenol hydroxylase P1 protein n=1 Tax=Allopseudospirillum japonicum TaxID=64971 RepID=A0A1H6S863_9GAMM|nr:aromatic/alkene monooxygenase hydroxylase subunit beta [Allopseudospirillum japonicum]SEI59612.1 Phenol hydroxylase P1 protein [Allopseudospirillum japonicum]